MTDWIGRILGRVRIESLIARGGMAEVYLGTHTTLQREVAVKILRDHFDDDARPRERFEREAQAVAKLRHPNIVQVFDFDTVDSQPYIVMEYIRGPSLSKYLAAFHARNRRLELPLVSRLLTGVANALQYAHESGVIHRDVKPGNILLTSRSLQIAPGETIPLDFEPVLTDFGLVRFLNSSRQTTVGQTAGTPAYISPEQAMGLATDGRTDIYSLGVVLYELLSGRVPFDGETTMSILLKHLHEVPPPIPGLSPALQNVLDRALAKNADNRYQEPKELAAAFHSALEEDSEASTLLTVTRVRESAKKNTRPESGPQRYWKQAVLAGALVTLASASMWMYGRLPASTAETPTPLAPSDTPTALVPIALGPTGALQFHDQRGLLDRATLIAQAMPAPPSGSQYQVWLVNGMERLSLGLLTLDGEGRGTLTFDQPEGQNLIAAYHGVEVTIKPESGSDPETSDRVSYFYALPDAGLDFLRGLMVTFPTTPQQIGLIHGLAENGRLMDQTARQLLSDYQDAHGAGVRQDAEAMLNLLVGDENQELYKDWNADGEVTDPGDGYGLLLNGNHLGYIQAVYAQADYAVNSAGASRNMIINGENVKMCAQNLAGWAPQLRDHLLAILNAPDPSSGIDADVQRAAALADQMLHGVDVNENGMIEPISEECGVLGAYEYTYHMADMPLLPVNRQEPSLSLTGTVTPTLTLTSGTAPIPTPTRRPNEPQPTQPPATQPPSNNNNNNNNGNGNNGNGPEKTKEPKPTRRP